jgi:DNA modification methylase
MQTESVKLSQVTVNSSNPRTISKEKFDKLINSILVLPKMLELRPVVTDDTMVALGGNMRYRALSAIAELSIDEISSRLGAMRDFQKKTEAERTALLAYWGKWKQNPVVPIVKASALSEDEKREFIIKDNVGYGEWDMDMLANEWPSEDLDDWGLDVWQDQSASGEGGDGNNPKGEGIKDNPLNERFIVPPFSILDTRKGYWQARKKLWRNIVSSADIGKSREGTLIQSPEILYKDLYKKTRKHREELGLTFKEYLDKYVSDEVKEREANKVIAQGTSLFDPVLAEIIMRWFCTPKGRVIDPFGGEQTKGIVAGELGLTYRAVEIRPEQVEANIEATKKYENVRYVCGDSNNISQIVTEDGFDLCFTSPPYYDLEVYSKEDMSALGTYEEFMAQYENIFRQCVDKLADGAFCVVKIGEIRDKKTGAYRNFVGDNISMFMRLGLNYYNEIIIIEPAASTALRAARYMESRKVAKLHQNILVFYKGDLKKIKERYPRIEYNSDDQDFFTTESNGEAKSDDTN